MRTYRMTKNSKAHWARTRRETEWKGEAEKRQKEVLSRWPRFINSLQRLWNVCLSATKLPATNQHKERGGKGRDRTLKETPRERDWTNEQIICSNKYLRRPWKLYIFSSIRSMRNNRWVSWLFRVKCESMNEFSVQRERNGIISKQRLKLAIIKRTLEVGRSVGKWKESYGSSPSGY